MNLKKFIAINIVIITILLFAPRAFAADCSIELETLWSHEITHRDLMVFSDKIVDFMKPYHFASFCSGTDCDKGTELFRDLMAPKRWNAQRKASKRPNGCLDVVNPFERGALKSNDNIKLNSKPASAAKNVDSLNMPKKPSAVSATTDSPSAPPPLENIWLIGKMNSSYFELTEKPARDWLPGYDKKFPNGIDIDPAAKLKKETFPPIQLGPLDHRAANKTYPVRIRFNLTSVLPGGYALTAAFLGTDSIGGGSLELDINGTKNSQPVPAGKNEDVLNSRTNASSPSRVIFFIPASNLRPGVNTITLTLNNASWVVYDFIQLEALADASRPAAKEFTAVAPPFLVKNGSSLAHDLRVSCFYIGPAQNAAVSVTLANKQIGNASPVKPGWNNFHIMIPEQLTEASASVTLRAAGKTIAQSTVPIVPVRHITISLMPHSHLDIGYPDIQPNIAIGQKTYLENALDMIDKKTAVPMTWIVEANWPLYNLLKQISPYDIYGKWLKNTPLTQTVPGQFWKDTATMRDSAFTARVTSSSAAPADALNNRRAVDGSVMGWTTAGAAKGAWIQLDFPSPRAFNYLMLRQGREAANKIKSMTVTFTGAGNKRTTETTGALSLERERLSVKVPAAPVKTIRIEITGAENPSAPASFMEIETWEKSDPAATRARALKAIKDGRMEVGGLYMNFLTQFMPTEWLIRSMLRSHEISKLSGAPIKTALITDVPGFSFAIPDVLSGSGIRYFYTGINPDHAPTALEGMPRAFYWQGPGGGKVLVFRSFNDYNEGWRLGFTISADEIEQKLPAFLSDLDAQQYPYDSLPLRTLGDITDDGPVAEKLPQIVAEWNSRWAFPRVEIGAPTKFLTAFENQYAKTLPLLKGDWTGFWEDGVGSSALETTNARAAQRDTLAYEALSAIQDRILGTSKPAAAAATELDEQLYLYQEHTWGADISIAAPDSPQTTGQWAFKQLDFGDYPTDNLANELLPTVKYFAPKPQHDGSTVALLNTTGFERKALDYRLSAGAFDEVSSVLTDAAIYLGENKKVSGKHYDFGGVDMLRAPDTNYVVIDNDAHKIDMEMLPALGIKYYELTKDENEYKKESEVFVSYTLENNYYKLLFDQKSGAITSIFDKESGKELVSVSDSAPGMGEFLFINGKPNSGAQTMRTENVSFIPGYTNKEYAEIRTKGSTAFFPDIQRTIRLYNNIKKIDITYTLKKEENLAKENLFFAFPFNVPGGELRLEVTGGMITPEKDQLPGASRDWISVQDSLAAVSDDFSILMSTPDAPLIIPGDIHILEFQKKLNLKNTTVYSWPMNNNWHTNYKASQGGDFTFRYSITSQKGRAKDSEIIRFGQDNSQPISAFLLKGGEGGNSTGEVNFLTIDKPNIRLLGLKKAEDGDGLIVRLQEMDGLDTPVTLRLHPALKITAAERTNLVEDPIQKLPVGKSGEETTVTGTVPAHGLLTIRLK